MTMCFQNFGKALKTGAGKQFSIRISKVFKHADMMRKTQNATG